MLSELIDKAILSKDEERSKRVRSGRFTPSSFGRCFRMQIWRRKQEPETNKPNVEALRRMAVGTLFHDFIEGFFKGQTEIRVEDEDVLGFLDIEIEDEIIDIKTVRSFQFKKACEKNYNIYEDNLPYALQIGYYMMKRGKKKGQIVYVDKDSFAIREVIIDIDRVQPLVEQELSTLRAFWASNELPKGVGRVYGGKEGQYCPFQNKCLSMGLDCMKKQKFSEPKENTNA